MSEHAWVLENLASYVAGGLDTAESERLQEHVAGCESCAKALAEAQAVDGGVEALFSEVRPDAALEDRMIQALRSPARRQTMHTPAFIYLTRGAAALVLLGGMGAGANFFIGRGDLPFPGMAPKQSAPASSRVAISMDASQSMAQMADGSVRGADQGLTSAFGNSPTVVLQDVDRLAQELRDKEVAALLPEQSSRDSTPGWRSQAGMSRQVESFKGTHSDDAQQKMMAKSGKMSGEGMADMSRMLQLPAEKKQELSSSLGNGAQITDGTAFSLAIPTPGRTDLSGKDAPPDKAQGQGGEQFHYYAYRNNQLGFSTGTTYFKPEILSVQLGQASKEENKPAQTNQPGQEKKEGKEDKGGAAKADPEAPAPVTQRKIIRSGDIEFEIDSFDSAVATIIKLVSQTRGGFVATVNSEKLPNGKVRGSVVVRVPPERLDMLVLDLRKELGKGGELKGQRIGSQDITKQYTDMESRLRAAQAMQERLLQIIKTGKGEIKDLLAAEKELGVWRTKIEELEGELRYYANQVALSTLTITLTEKEIRAPFALVETEQIHMGVEVDDVDKALQQALAAVAAVKGRITKSELKQHAVGQYSATLNFEVSPEAAGPLRDRLRQLGNVARFDIERVQQAEGGSGPAQNLKSKRNDAQFFVSFYNLTTVAPRDTVHLNLACVEVETVFKNILAKVQEKNGRIVSSNLNRNKDDQTTATIAFEVKTAEADALLLSIKALGEVMRLQLTENADVQNTTRSKRGFNVQLFSLGQIQPRETMVLTVASRDVPAAYQALKEAVAKAKGRVLAAQLNEQDKQSISAQLDFDVRRTEESAILAALTAAGDIYGRKSTSAQDSENVIDTKVRLQVTFLSVDRIAPRETVILGIEVANVDQTMAILTALVNDAKGRTVDAKMAHERSGRVTGKLIFEVPLAAAAGLVEHFKSSGTVRVQDAFRNAQVPEGRLSTARLEVTLSNVDLIVPSDEGLWPKIRTGLSTSFVALSWSLTVVIVGVCFVLPWALIGYGLYRLVVWMRRKPASPATPA
jgi:hypothetical protein